MNQERNPARPCLFGARAPTSAWAYHDRDNVYLDMGDYDNAVKDYTEAIRLVPRQAWTYANRSRVYLSKKQYEQAIADATEAIRLRQNYSSAYLARGEAYLRKRQYDRAISDLSKAIDIDPLARAPALRLRAEAHRLKGDKMRAAIDERWAKRDASDRLIMGGATR